MPWGTLDDSFHDNPKLLAAGLEATGLYARGISWTNRHRSTRGLIPASVVPILGSGAKHPLKVARALVDNGLWEPEAGGFRVHDWTVYQRKLDANRNGNDPQGRAIGGAKRAARAERDDSGRFLPRGEGPANAGLLGLAGPANARPASQLPAASPSLTGPGLTSTTGLTLSETSGSTGVSEAEPDTFDESRAQDLEELVAHRFGEVLELDDQRHLWLKACRGNRLFADVWPGIFPEIREEHGDQVLTEVLRRAVDRDLEAVSFPRAWLMTLVDEVANGGRPEQASAEAEKEAST